MRKEFFGIKSGYFASMAIAVDAYKQQVGKAAGVECVPQAVNFMNSLEAAEDILDTIPSEYADELRRVVKGIIGFDTIFHTINALSEENIDKMVQMEAEELKRR